MGYIEPVSHYLNRSRGTIKIGDTLFVDGVPHTQCGICELPIKTYGYGEVIAGRNKQHKVLKEYRVFLGYMVRKEELESNGKGVIEVVVKWIPVIHSKPGCFDCWNRQEQERQRNKANGINRAVFHNIRGR